MRPGVAPPLQMLQEKKLKRSDDRRRYRQVHHRERKGERQRDATRLMTRCTAHAGSLRSHIPISLRNRVE